MPFLAYYAINFEKRTVVRRQFMWDSDPTKSKWECPKNIVRIYFKQFIIFVYPCNKYKKRYIHIHYKVGFSL